VAAAELVGLALRNRKYRRIAHAIAGVVGIAGLAVLYETAEHGGTLVYSYAGGVGVRSGAPQDVERLLVAGLYNQAMLDRRQGRADDAARLFDEMARRRPADPAVLLLQVQSLLEDRNDAQGALSKLHGIEIPARDRFLRYRYGWVRADAYRAAGFTDSARAALQALAAEFEGSERVQQQVRARLEELQ
jgi:hypothetical protein